jgi:hypothetical protein
MIQVVNDCYKLHRMTTSKKPSLGHMVAYEDMYETAKITIDNDLPGVTAHPLKR